MQEASNQPDWREKTNAAYQDAMKTILSLATASLVLPIVLIRTFADGDSPKSLFITRRAHMAYIAWLFLFLSIILCLLFFFVSAKYVKIISSGNFNLEEGQFVENIRDWSSIFSIVFFALGIVFSGLFFWTLVAPSKPSSVGQSPGGDRPDRA